MPRILVLAAVLPLLAAAWEPIACPEAVFDCSEQFATVRVLDDFAAGVGTWQAANGSQNPRTRLELDPAMPHGGNPSLRVEAEFSGDKKLEYISAGARDMAIPESGHGIGLWFRSEGGPVTLRLRISDASGEIHQLDFPRNPAASADGRWSYVAVKLASQSGAWGGDGNRKLDYPCKLLAIVGDRPRQGFAGPATLWFGQVELVREVERQGELKIEVDRKRLGNLYEPGARIALRATGEGARIRWQWQDYFGRTLGEGDGPASGCEAPAEFARDGFYLCTLTLADAAGLTLDRRTFRAAVLPPPAAGARNDFVGFCTHFTRTTAWPSEGIGLFARYGFGHLRDELSWGGVELEKGQLAIPAGPSAYLAEARAHGIAPLVILDYANRFYDNHGFPNSPEAVAGFARYAEFMARELADRVTDWEVWNEWSGGCGMRDRPGEHTPEMYAQLLRATYPAVRRGNPQATVIGIGGEHSKHHLAQIEGMMRGAPEAMDAFSVHSYRYPATPEATDLAGEIQHVAQLAKDCGTTERVWITEIGWPTHADPTLAGPLMKGIVSSGLKAIDPNRTNWTAALLDDPDYPRGFTPEEADTAREMFRPAPVRELTFADLATLDPAATQVLVLPPNESFPGPQFAAIESYVRRGGVVVLWSGVPLYYEMKQTAEGGWEQTGASEDFRRRLRIGWEAWWTKDGVPKEIKKLAPGQGWDPAVEFPAKTPEGTRFLTASALAPGDRFIPLVQATEGEYQGAVAAAYALDSDLKGGVIVATFRSLGRNVSIERQGLICPRAYLVAFQAGVERMFWYEFQAVEIDPYYNEHHFGMVHRDLSPKPAYTALQALTRARPAGSKAALDAPWRNDDGLYFPHWTRPDGQTVWALWRGTGDATYSVQVTGTVAEAFDHLGQAKVLPLADGRATLTLGESILYLVGPEQVTIEPAQP